MREPLTDRELAELERIERAKEVSPYEMGVLAALRMRADEVTRQRIDRLTERKQ